MEFARTIFRSLFEVTTCTTNFLNSLFAIFSNKEGILKSDQIPVYLKEWMLSLFKYKCYEWVTQN